MWGLKARDFGGNHVGRRNRGRLFIKVGNNFNFEVLG
jgi:hypothetical protein